MKYVIMGIVVLVLAVPAGLYFAGMPPFAAAAEGEEEQKVVALPPTYLPLDPPFVVNFTHRGTLRYLQVSLEVTYPDLALLEKVNERMPQIRNDLILLFSGQDYEQISTQGGKEQLRREIMAAINQVIGVKAPVAAAVETGSGPAAPQLAAAGSPASSGEVYITNFVMQ